MKNLLRILLVIISYSVFSIEIPGSYQKTCGNIDYNKKNGVLSAVCNDGHNRSKTAILDYGVKCAKGSQVENYYGYLQCTTWNESLPYLGGYLKTCGNIQYKNGALISAECMDERLGDYGWNTSLLDYGVKCAKGSLVENYYGYLLCATWNESLPYPYGNYLGVCDSADYTNGTLSAECKEGRSYNRITSLLDYGLLCAKGSQVTIDKDNTGYLWCATWNESLPYLAGDYLSRCGDLQYKNGTLSAECTDKRYHYGKKASSLNYSDLCAKNSPITTNSALYLRCVTWNESLPYLAGDYLNICGNIQYKNDILSAECVYGGGWIASSLNYNARCVKGSRVTLNRAGSLECSHPLN